jgi:hypothetical protein
VIRLSLLQFRVQAITAAAALAAFAILLAATGPRLAARYAASGVGSCHGGGCGQLASTFLGQLKAPYPLLYLLGVAVILLVPAIIGIFWGAPLVASEFEAGTHHLVWNQSVTRTRWLAVKLAVIGLAAMAVTEGLSLMQAWWAAPIGRAVGRGGTGTGIAKSRWAWLVFATHGITPLGYAAFASPWASPPVSSSAAPSRPWPSPWPSSPPSRSPCPCGSARICSHPTRRPPRSAAT